MEKPGKIRVENYGSENKKCRNQSYLELVSMIKEHQHTEWKQFWRDEYLKGICGFANTCFRAGMVESWGRGIDERIRQACGDAGIPAPELRYEQTGL